MTKHQNHWQELQNGNYACELFLIVVIESNGKGLLFRNCNGEPAPPMLYTGNPLDCMKEANKL